MCNTTRGLTIFLLSLGFSTVAVGATYSYRLTEIPLLSIPQVSIGHGRAISNAGHVTGVVPRCSDSRCWEEAFLWYGNTSFLNLFPSSPIGEANYGADVNHLGQVTGYFNNTQGGGKVQQAFYWDGATTKKLLGALGGDFSAGSAINAKGHITGYAYLAGNAFGHAFLWDGATMRDLGTLGGPNSAGTGITAAGHVTGDSGTPDGQTRAFLWNGNSMRDLGSLGGSYSRATSINAKDQVVGYSHTKSGLTHAFIWRDGAMEDLGVLCCDFSVANAINNSGQVVGQSGVPFLWENGRMRNINDLISASDPLKSSFTVVSVEDINNIGQMTGVAESNSDKSLLRAYLISPAYKLSAFLSPVRSTWQRSSTVRIAIAVLDVNRVRIPDQRAKALQAVACRVKVSAKGSQTLAPTCMNYNATTHEFWFDWRLAGTGTGAATIEARVNYGAPGPLKVLKTQNISITN